MKTITLAMCVLLSLVLVGIAGCGEDFDDKTQVQINKKNVDEQPAATADPAAAPATPATTDPAAAPAAPAADVKTYALVTDESSIDWEGSKVTETHIGGFAEFTGTVTVPGGNLEQLSVEVTVVMDSLYSDAGGLTEVMKDPKFFDVATHPQSTFKSTGVTKGDAADQYMVSGDFQLNGVTNNITFPATIKLDGDSLTASSEFAVNRLDWNVVYQGVGDGVIYDKALIRFEVIAKAQ